jgi:uncharacterized protein (DUF1786 family)
MSENIERVEANSVEIGTSKIGTFSQHIEASDADVHAVIDTLEDAGFDVERKEREGLTELTDDPYYVVHVPAIE